MKIHIKTESTQDEIEIVKGRPLFIVGANGSGKSAMVYDIASKLYKKKPKEDSVNSPYKKP